MTIDASIGRQLVGQSVVPMECTIPPDMTLRQWRSRGSARSQPIACEHIHDTTSRYDPVEERLTFLLVCPVCGTERVIETLRYAPRFQPLPSAGSTEPNVHRLPSRRHVEPEPQRRAA